MNNDKKTHAQRRKNACLNSFSSQVSGKHFNFISARCLEFFSTFCAAPDQMHGYYHIKKGKKASSNIASSNIEHSMTGPEGNSEFCFPRISVFPETKSRETKFSVSQGTSH